MIRLVQFLALFNAGMGVFWFAFGIGDKAIWSMLMAIFLWLVSTTMREELDRE